MGLRVEEDCLPRGMNGCYCDALGLIVLHDKLNARQRRCTLCHELIHARHHDLGCGTRYALISPVDYGMAETVYEGNTWMMAVELGVTIQVLNDYRQLLYDSGVCVQ